MGWSRGAVRYAVEARATVLLVVGLRAGRPIQIAPLALVNRAATAKRDDTPQVVQPTRCATRYKVGQVAQLVEKYGFTEFSAELLYINGLISRNDRVKLLATGELKAPMTFKVNAASEKAKAAVEASGGTLEIIA